MRIKITSAALLTAVEKRLDRVAKQNEAYARTYERDCEKVRPKLIANVRAYADALEAGAELPEPTRTYDGNDKFVSAVLIPIKVKIPRKRSLQPNLRHVEGLAKALRVAEGQELTLDPQEASAYLDEGQDLAVMTLKHAPTST